MAKFEITWEAHEFEYREKGVSWYWLSIIVAALIVAFSVWIRNFLFGLFIVIAEVLFIVWGNRVPRVIEFRLSDDGIEIDGQKFHALKEFESWSVNDLGNGYVELMLSFRSKVKTPLTVLVSEEHLEAIRTNLKALLKEVEHDPSLIDSIEKLTKF